MCVSRMFLLNRLQSTFNVWYMDDGTIGDNADVLLNDFQLLIAEGKNLDGLTVNHAKCSDGVLETAVSARDSFETGFSMSRLGSRHFY